MCYESQRNKNISKFSTLYILQVGVVPFHSSWWIYSCNLVRFVSAKLLLGTPQLMDHEFHPGHNLTLLQQPPYASGKFLCNACGTTGEGLVYHCRICSFDLHPCCAHMPTSVVLRSHVHPLRLCKESSYSNKMFICNICHRPGDRWLYRCDACGFNAHLGCVGMPVASQDMPNVPISHINPVPSQQSHHVVAPVMPHAPISHINPVHLQQTHHVVPHNGHIIHGNPVAPPRPNHGGGHGFLAVAARGFLAVAGAVIASVAGQSIADVLFE